MKNALQAELDHQPVSLIERGSDDGCWLWVGPMAGDAPVVYLAGRKRMAVRRFVFELTRRPLLRSEKVTTTCKAPRCIRPGHLVVHGPSTGFST